MSSISHELNILHELPKFQKTIAEFPEIVDDFSIDSNSNFTKSRINFKHCVSNFKNYYNLNDYTARKPRINYINPVLSYIENIAKPGETLRETIKEADFVCQPGVLTRLSASKLEVGGNGWKFVAIEFDGVIFIRPLNTDKTTIVQKRNFNGSENVAPIATTKKQCKFFTNLSYNFSNYVLKHKNRKPDVIEKTYNACFINLPKSSEFDKMKLFYVNEIDGVNYEGKYVGVKTSKIYKPQKHIRIFNTTNDPNLFIKNKYFKSKMMNWYMQSKLANVSIIIVGFLDDLGTVSCVKSFETEQIRSLAYNDFEYGNGMEVAHFILSHVRFHLRANSGKAVVFEREPDERDVRFTVCAADKFTILTPKFRSTFGTNVS